MMSGLLDKANETAKDIEDSDKAEKSTNDIENVQSTGIADEVQPVVDKKITISLQVAGVIGLMVSLFLLVQVGWLYASFMDYLIAFSVLLVGWALFNGSDYVQSDLSALKLGITAVAFTGLFLATVVGTIFMNAGGGVTISSVTLDGDNDEIDLLFYGPGGMEFSVELLVDGQVEYTRDLEIDRDREKHSISLDKFWAGNSKDMNDRIKVDYEIRVDSEGGNDSFSFNDIMLREVDTGFVRVTEVFTTDSGGEKEYTGIEVEMIVGMGDPDAVFGYNNNYFTGTTPKTIVSDWTAKLKVRFGNSVVYEYNSVTANEGIVSGLGEFWSGWVVMPGTEAGNLARDDFYDSDGCYTFEIELVNVLGGTYTDTSSRIEFNWDSNEAAQGDENNNSQDQPATEC